MGFIWAKIPEDLRDTINNRFLTVRESLQPFELAMVDAGFEEYKKKCDVEDSMLPYPIWVIVMYESYTNKQ